MLERMFEEFDRMRREMDRLFERTFGSRWTPTETSGEWTFTLPVETGWTNDYLNLRFILPGVTEKDFDLTVQGNQLVIRGERKAPENFGREDTVWHAIPYGKFERVVDLPNGLDLDHIDAHLHDGVLDIRIPLTAEVKPRRIEIKAGEERKQLAAA